jgi:hypothetical protein
MSKLFNRLVLAAVISTINTNIVIASTKDDMKDAEQLLNQQQKVREKIKKLDRLLGGEKPNPDKKGNPASPQDSNSNSQNNAAQTEQFDLQKFTASIPLPILVGIPALLSLIGLFVLYKSGIVQKYYSKATKEAISDDITFLHNRSLKELKKLGNSLNSIDDDKFNSQEFVLFLKIKDSLENGDNEYKKIEHSIKLLEAALAAQVSYLSLEQTELRYRSYKQQELYDFVAKLLLEENLDKNNFRESIKKKLSEILPLVNTEEGRAALQSYLKDLNTVSEHEFGLKLLALFKQYNLTDFSILKSVSETVNQLQRKNLFDLKGLNALVIINYDVFEKLGPILGLSTLECKPDTFARMLQYFGLKQRHSVVYLKFQELMEVLRKWLKPYNSVIAIRQEYESNKYHQPKEFTEDIPGLNIYQKYEQYVENKAFYRT